ncbi:MAG: aspartate kinase [Spirochaetaceae bacterium]|jgi:aspartate kinase|nr:aspartate kinase [Spirochaetaceae bacterium]
MVVMKFGGSSVEGSEGIRRVGSIISRNLEQQPLVVLSAMGDTTDFLLKAGEEALEGRVNIEALEKTHRDAMAALGLDSLPQVDSLFSELTGLLTGVSMIKELSARSRDLLVSFGERLSVRIVAAWLQKTGVPARPVDAWDGGFLSNSQFTQAELLEDVWLTIPAAFGDYISGRDKAVPIVTGFIAMDKRGNITTLGRGGSDLTATMLGAALRVREVQTWKDVDGILTADPRVVPGARTVAEVTYDEASELAFFGSQVLHPRSMQPCRKTGTVVRVKNSYNPDGAGSIILPEHTGNPGPVRAITAVKNITLIDIISSHMLGASGFLAHIFNQFLKWNISIDVIATSEVSVSLTVNTGPDLTGLIADIGRAADVRCHAGKAIITLICDVTRSSSILASAFSALSGAGINVQMISQGASKVNISLLCEDREADSVVRILHAAFFG